MKNQEPPKCVNCNLPLLGPYCYYCGEKVVQKNDYTIKHLFGQAFSFLTNIDSKLFKTFHYLFLKPGRLTQAHTAGIRKPFMKPFQLFVLANILFFLFLNDFDLFRSPAKWFFDMPDRMCKAEAIGQAQEVSINEVYLMYDAKSSAFSRGAVAVLLPVFGFILMLVNYRKKMAFGKHVIFAIHFFSFLLLFLVIWAILMTLSTLKHSQWSNFLLIQLPLISSILGYLFFSMKHFYQYKTSTALGKATITTILIVITLILYRNAISQLSLYLL